MSPGGEDGLLLPQGACDSHVHVFDPDRFPYRADRRFSPGSAPLSALRAHKDRLGLDRLVLVQPSVYGTDHRCLLEALIAFGTDVARGVAILDPATPDKDIAALDAAGCRGARLNFEVDRLRDPEEARRRLEAVRRCLPPGWHISLYCHPTLLVGLADLLAGLPTPVVVEHFGGMRPDRGGTGQDGFDLLCALLRDRKAFVKFSGAYQISSEPGGYGDVTPVASKLIEAGRGQVIWGTNWPHTAGSRRGEAADPQQVEPFRSEDDHAALRQLRQWAGDAATWQAILAGAPAQAYGFAPPQAPASANSS